MNRSQASHEHRCQRSDDAEAVVRNLALFGRWSGDRGRTYPIDVRVKALRLLRRDAEARALQSWGQLVIPLQRAEEAAAHRSRVHARRAGHA